MARPTGTEPDGRSLHELAVDVVTDIHKLATGLAHAGAPPNITRQIEGTSSLYAQIAKGLAAGPVGQQAAGGPGSAPPPEPAAAPPPQPGPPPGAPMPGGPGAPQAQAPAHGDLHNTIASMHHDSVNAAVRAGR